MNLIQTQIDELKVYLTRNFPQLECDYEGHAIKILAIIATTRTKALDVRLADISKVFEQPCTHVDDYAGPCGRINCDIHEN